MKPTIAILAALLLGISSPVALGQDSGESYSDYGERTETQIAEKKARREAYRLSHANAPKVRDARLYEYEGAFKVKVRLVAGTDPDAWFSQYAGKVDVTKPLVWRGKGAETQEDGSVVVDTKRMKITMMIDQRTLIELEGDQAVRSIQNREEDTEGTVYGGYKRSQ
jgi:hypothetical protein